MRASSVTKAPFQTLWHLHPGVRSGDQLSLGERAADRMQHDGFLAVCLLILRGHDLVGGPKHADLAACPQPRAFDPYPYILLNLFLSMLAGVQAAALLIAAKRAEAISLEIALHTEKNTDDIKTLIAENTARSQRS